MVSMVLPTAASSGAVKAPLVITYLPNSTLTKMIMHIGERRRATIEFIAA